MCLIELNQLNRWVSEDCQQLSSEEQVTLLRFIKNFVGNLNSDRVPSIEQVKSSLPAEINTKIAEALVDKIYEVYRQPVLRLRN